METNKSQLALEMARSLGASHMPASDGGRGILAMPTDLGMSGYTGVLGSEAVLSHRTSDIAYVRRRMRAAACVVIDGVTVPGVLLRAVDDCGYAQRALVTVTNPSRPLPQQVSASANVLFFARHNSLVDSDRSRALWTSQLSPDRWKALLDAVAGNATLARFLVVDNRPGEPAATRYSWYGASPEPPNLPARLTFRGQHRPPFLPAVLLMHMAGMLDMCDAMHLFGIAKSVYNAGRAFLKLHPTYRHYAQHAHDICLVTTRFTPIYHT
jgi:hypothetical protein